MNGDDKIILTFIIIIDAGYSGIDYYWLLLQLC